MFLSTLNIHYIGICNFDEYVIFYKRIVTILQQHYFITIFIIRREMIKKRKKEKIFDLERWNEKKENCKTIY